MSNNTREPAFPSPRWEGWGSPQEGMTLRDYFASRATEEDINAHIWKGHKEDYVMVDGYGKKLVAKREAMWTREEAKYRYADTMLKAREND